MARKHPPPRGPQLDLAGNLSVAFVNTVGARDDNRQLGISSYPELLAWSQQAGTLSALEAERLRQRALEQPEAAAAAYEQVAAVRLNLFELFRATAMERQLPDKDLRAANEALRDALPALRMVPAEQGITWGWAGDENALDRMLWPMLFSAAELLIAAQGRPYVRQCAFKGCLLFFIDRSPSGQRRWCEMKTCGNRAKAQRHNRREKSRKSGSFLF
ncbi:MAG: hypothetical protein GY953_08805 [bacterium]|nr:hypothetical protein [bacterium]